MLAVCSVILLPSFFVRDHAVVGAGAPWREFWLVRLALNLLGYATVALPIALMVHYLKRNKYNEMAGECLRPVHHFRRLFLLLSPRCAVGELFRFPIHRCLPLPLACPSLPTSSKLGEVVAG